MEWCRTVAAKRWTSATYGILRGRGSVMECGSPLPLSVAGAAFLEVGMPSASWSVVVATTSSGR
ncbi:hypothetical protein OVA24_03095 [Luteolibacter sp. SL250]|uniref:hypothetical protein n=1 Tax=Luteolibacter sp. SL250 TaxID=2995170 RepID=UPI00226E2F1E|nr:hypothetical protein [Luteolibacter sp. SL250]WAC20363.1 hypothetical protein OVA24_03095 [Luteolibacter sp. SL250]